MVWSWEMGSCNKEVKHTFSNTCWLSIYQPQGCYIVKVAEKTENDGVLADTNRLVHEAETEFIVQIY